MFLTFNDSEYDHVYSDLVSVFHPAGVNSSILPHHVVDLQVEIASLKLAVGALYALGAF